MIPRWLKRVLLVLSALFVLGMAYLCVIGTYAMVTSGAWGEGVLFALCSGWLAGAMGVDFVHVWRLPVRTEGP